MGDEYYPRNSGESLRKIREMIRAMPAKPRRNVFLPGEGLGDFQRAQGNAIAAGKTLAEFEWDRLVKNGWTLEDERRIMLAAQTIGFSLYKVHVKVSKTQRRNVGINLYEEGIKLMQSGKFPMQTAREPGSDDEEES